MLKFCAYDKEIEFKHLDKAQSVQWLGCGMDYRGSIPGRGKDLLLAAVPRPVLGSTEPSIQWGTGG
jgi:hypothetical protein